MFGLLEANGHSLVACLAGLRVRLNDSNAGICAVDLKLMVRCIANSLNKGPLIGYLTGEPDELTPALDWPAFSPGFVNRLAAGQLK